MATFVEGLVDAPAAAPNATLRTKAALARMQSAVKRQAALIDALVSAHANGELSEAESMSYTVGTVQSYDYERMKELREALTAEAKAENVPLSGF